METKRKLFLNGFLIAAALALAFSAAACDEDFYCDDYDYYPPHDDYTPPPPPPIPPVPEPSYYRYDVSFIVSALAFDYETDDIVGDIKISYSIDDWPFDSLGYTDYEPWYTDVCGSIPDALINFGDPDLGPIINIGDMREDEVIYLALVAEDPYYYDYYPRYIDLEIRNCPDGIHIYSDGADIEIDMYEADYLDPIFPVRAIFDLEWKY